MPHNFTPEDLVRYIYRETTAAETVAIAEALAADAALRGLHDDLVSGKRMVPALHFMPSERSIQRILQHSEQTFCPSC